MSLCTPWIGVDDLTRCGLDPSAYDPDTIDFFAAAASEVLFRLTGQQWPGECDETVRPCGTMSDGCGCAHMRDCGCGGFPAVDLARSDVTAVDTVQIGDTTVPSTAWRLDSGRWLVRTDGDSWPCCQDMAAEPGEPDTFVITLTYGAPVPAALVAAAAAYCVELLRGCAGSAADGPCRLPGRVASITRQGVSVNRLVIAAAGGVGLYDVDVVVEAFNPDHRIRMPGVWSPETAAPSVRTPG